MLLPKEVDPTLLDKLEFLGDKLKKKKAKLSKTAIAVIRKRYLKKNSTGEPVEEPEDMFWRVACNVAFADLHYNPWTDIEKRIEEFYNLMVNLEFLPNSPTLMNAGREIQQLSACFVLPIEDSMDSIFEAVKSTAIIHKTGGGTGFSFNKLRPKNDRVASTGGVASGPISFMKVFNAATDVIKQGGTRRGANMAILNVDHPDIIDFINSKKDSNELTNFNISVGITEDFMEKVKAGQNYSLINPHTGEVEKESSASEVFDLIARRAWENGEPGIVFMDRLNKANPTPHIGNIESTNPCIVGNSLVSTQYGLMRMDRLVELYGKGSLGVLTDNRVKQCLYSEMEATYNQPLCRFEAGVGVNLISRAWQSGLRETYRVETCAGFELEATDDHKIMTTQGWIGLKDLKPGVHKVLLQCGEGLFSNDKKLPIKVENNFIGKNGRTYKLNLPCEWSYELGLILGGLIGDGWLRDKDKNCRVGFTFGPSDLKFLERVKFVLNEWYGFSVKEIKRKSGIVHLSYHSKYLVDFFKSLGVRAAGASKKVIPESIFTAPREAVVGFLQGLFTSDGTVAVDERNGNYYVRLTSKSQKLLKEVQVLLLNFGIFSRIYDRSRKPWAKFSYINKEGYKKEYICDGILFELNISRENVRIFLDEIGFLGLKHGEKISRLRGKQFHKNFFKDDVLRIVKAGKKKVYDLTEPLTHSFIANGLVISNCGEQPLLPYEACNLGSINLLKMLKEINGTCQIDFEKLEKTVNLAISFLDNVIDVNNYPLPQIERLAKSNRKIGLGIMGFADMLIALKIPYDSKLALDKAEEIMKFIQEKARLQSARIAKERGVFPNYDGSIYDGEDKFRVRNATVTTIAPTGTLSIIAGCSSGIEPLFGICLVRRILGGEKFIEVNPYFEKIMMERSIFSQDLMENIAARGTVKGMQKIPKDVQDIFVTSYDIEPQWHVMVQAVFQEYTDNAVSKTVNFLENATEEDVKKVFILAYELGCKGVTIYRHGSRDKQVIEVGSNGEKASEQEEMLKLKIPYEISCCEDTNGNSFGQCIEKVSNLIRPRSRPEITFGLTEKIDACGGRLYITVNYDEYGVCEVVVQTSGISEECALNFDLLNRFITLAASSGIQFGYILEQLKGYKCSRFKSSEDAKSLSCVEGVAGILDRAWKKSDNFRSLAGSHTRYKNTSLEHNLVCREVGNKIGSSALEELHGVLKKETAASKNLSLHRSEDNLICPECRGKVEYAEGCMLCRTCGFSKCG